MDGTWKPGLVSRFSVPADTSLNLTGSVGDVGEGVIANGEVIASVSKRWPFPFCHHRSHLLVSLSFPEFGERRRVISNVRCPLVAPNRLT